MKIKFTRVTVTLMSVNAYIVFDEATREGVIIDPGGEPEKLTGAISREGITLRAILLTHGHCDHIGAVPEIKSAYGVPVLCHKDDAGFLENPEFNMSGRFGKSVSLSPDITVSDGEALCYAGAEITVIHTPGHTPGGCCFHIKNENILFSGDTLFKNSVGRSDFYLGDADKLISGIKTKLFTLPDITAVYPGHGEPTDIKKERMSNPFAR